MGYEIDFLPVGDKKSGDAITLRFGNLFGRRDEQTVIVVDGGYADTGQAVVNHLRTNYGTTKVDLVISTHPDGDHAAGLETVLSECEVGCLWMHQPWNHTDDIAKMFQNGRVTDKSVSESLRKSLDDARALERLAQANRIPIVEPFTGVRDASTQVYVVGPTLVFYENLLPDFRCTPTPAQPGILTKVVQKIGDAVKNLAEDWNIETLDDTGETSAENNSGAILLILVGDEAILLTGDAGIPAITEAVDFLEQREFDLTKIKFLQVPHHGSRRNIGPTLLDKLVGPKLQNEQTVKTAFVSVATLTDDKHPSKRVMNAFRRRGAPVHATGGSAKMSSHNAPGWQARGWGASTPLPLYTEVEEIED